MLTPPALFLSVFSDYFYFLCPPSLLFLCQLSTCLHIPNSFIRSFTHSLGLSHFRNHFMRDCRPKFTIADGSLIFFYHPTGPLQHVTTQKLLILFRISVRLQRKISSFLTVFKLHLHFLTNKFDQIFPISYYSKWNIGFIERLYFISLSGIFFIFSYFLNGSDTRNLFGGLTDKWLRFDDISTHCSAWLKQYFSFALFSLD